MRIAIQGIAGSFHDQAAQQYFANQSVEVVECANFQSVFEAVNKGTVDRGVVAVENSLHGSINQVYRLLAQQKLWVCGEIRLHIAMCLVGSKPQSIAQLNNPSTQVLSHFAAFGQCENWLSTHLPQAQQQEVSDTAQAVRTIVTEHDPHKVAIASKHAADLYNGVILAASLNDQADNYTRFFIISRAPVVDPKANRTSIILHENTTDKAGALYSALGVFAKANINLSKLDSHPRPGTRRSYAFYIDFDESAESAAGRKVVAELSSDGWKLQLLGSYQAHQEI